MIEDFFEAAVLAEKLGAKSFMIDEKKFDARVHFGKALFAEHVVRRKVRQSIL